MPSTTKKPAKSASKPSGKKPAAAAKKPTAKKPAKRADFGAPVEGFFARQPPTLRPILEELRALVAEAAPDAVATIKWGMPVYSIGGTMMCMLGAHKAHVNLVLHGPADAFADPEGRLAGESENGRHLKLTSIDELPRRELKGWLRTCAKLARAGGGK